MKVTSGWSCRAEAETAEVIGPSMDFAIAWDLEAPVAGSKTFRASRIVPIPMVMAQRGLSSPGAKNFELSSNVSLLRTFSRVREPMLEVDASSFSDGLFVGCTILIVIAADGSVGNMNVAGIHVDAREEIFPHEIMEAPRMRRGKAEILIKIEGYDAGK